MTSIFRDPSEFTVESLWGDILGVLMRRKRLIVIIAGSITVFLYAVLLNLNDKYAVQASLIVKLGTENLEAPVTVEKGGIFRQGVMKEEINTYAALLQSSPLLERAMDEIGLERFLFKPAPPESLLGKVKYTAKSALRWGKKQVNEGLIRSGLRKRLTERELVIQALSKWISVTHEKDSNVIQINMQIIDPVLGRDYLAALIDSYLQMHREHVLGSSSELLALTEQSEEARDSLEALRNDLMAYKNENAISSINEQRSGLTQILKELTEEVYHKERRIHSHRESLSHLSQRQGEIDPMVISNLVKVKGPKHQAILEKLAGLEVARADLTVRFKENTPQLIRIEQEIAKLEQMMQDQEEDIKSEETFIRNPVISELDGLSENIDLEIVAMESEIQSAREQISMIRDKLAGLDRAEVEIRRLEIEIEVAEDRYYQNASKREEARTREAFRQSEVANVNILVPPYYNAKPVYPRRLMYMLAGIAGALGIAFGIALLLEWTSDRIHDTQPIKSLPKLIVLGEYSLKNKRS